MNTQEAVLSLEDVFTQITDLATVEADAEVTRTREAYRLKHGEARGPGIYSSWDWARISFVKRLLPQGGDVLDVGVGSGQFINTLANTGVFHSVTGVDITTHSKFIRLSQSFEMKYVSVENLQLEPKSFDAVTCMEVLEHVDRTTFEAGLTELRRVCRGTLVLSVPFEEPEPLPSYHKLRFDRADLVRIWPNAKRILLRRPGVGWAMMFEDCTSAS
jgi:2-polyprenyl-3-methyl-5-hydroxy-6-metoxy-1,4-benzoquinol methylase